MRLPSKQAFRKEAEAIMASESYPDFNSEAVKQRLAAAHAELRQNYLGCKWPHYLAGKEYWSASGIDCYVDRNPYSGEVLGYFQNFNRKWNIAAAVDNIDRAQDIWRETPWKKHAEYLYSLAHALMSEKWTWRFVSALMHDTGKSAAEAWGEYNEVYRFVFIHVWWMFKRWGSSDAFSSCKLAGDYFGYSSKGKGIGLVIAPFNFPAAIPIRMLTLMLACGCVVILKGSATASLVTKLIYDVCEEVRKETGIGPEGMVNFAPGPGGEMADAFLSDPRVRIFSFTGSSEVCEAIQKKYHFSDRVGGNQLLTGSAETGGVNWVIVGNYANKQYVANQVVRANFGISGQKCSSVRLLFVREEDTYDMLELLMYEYNKIKYGDVLAGADMGPVIDMNARNTIERKIAKLEKEKVAKVAYRMKIDPSPSGQDVAPTILVAADVWEDANKMKTLLDTEIFGPVFTVVPYRDLDQVKALTRATKYALTGAILDEDPAVVATTQLWLPAGNSYGNRRCTGATAPEAFGGLGGTKSSFNSGLKGYDEMPLYMDNRTHSTIYHPDWTDEQKKIFVETMEQHAVTIKK